MAETRVAVAIRVRPELAFSMMKGFVLREEEGALDMTVNAQQNAFKFDHVFGPSVSQESVFHTCAASICDKVIEGFNGCIFAYGQTGAGKTYTMTGPANSDAFADRGICMRTASYLFAHASRLPPNDSLSIRLSVLEIYNESLTDLLREAPPPMAIAATLPPAPKLIIVDTPAGVVVPSLYVLPLSSEEDAFSLLLEADGNRVVAEHQLNRSSSRSHVVYTFYLTRTRARLDDKGRQILAPGGDPDVTQSKLHLVDLAGSERSAKTQSTGVVQKEAKYINKSLSFLEQVVLALTQSKRGHVPYRQSKLTYMLKDSLGGNCHTVMLACVWPHVNHVWETLSTLRFSARMKNIENAPVRNSLFSKEPSSQRALQQVQALKRELALRDRISGRDGWLPELTPTQRQHTARLAGALLALPAASESQLYAVPESELDIKSAAQVGCLVGCLRAAVWEACDRDSHKVVACIEKMLASFATAENDRRQRGGDMHPQQQQQQGDFGPTVPTSLGQPDAAEDTPGAAGPSPSTSPNPRPEADEDDDAGDPLLPNPLSSRVGMTFEDFREGPGRVLHEAYEEVRALSFLFLFPSLLSSLSFHLFVTV